MGSRERKNWLYKETGAPRPQTNMPRPGTKPGSPASQAKHSSKELFEQLTLFQFGVCTLDRNLCSCIILGMTSIIKCDLVRKI
jgi:hypothetical protein